ncbi:MAG: substrate-binding domain-containing protein [Lachnospiraceae bacterium]|nr:substrate-binding domain-containing protein [Lachnospiraceae bacterium]MDY4969203.1 substrate-binding domain-containing protein [Lachnospiraceae bacterium]
MKNSLSGNEKGSRRKQVILLTAAALAEVVCLIGLAFFIRTNTLLALILALSFQIPLVVRMFTENRRVKILCRILSVLLLTAGLIAFLGCHGRNYYIESMTEADNNSVDTERYQPFSEISALGRLDEEPELELSEDLPVLNGSASLLPLYSSVINMLYPDTIAGLNENGSPYRFTNTQQAYKELFSGKTDIVFSEKPSDSILKEAEKKGLELELIPIGWDAFVFFTNSSNVVTELTQEQLRDIYSGKVSNWSELGGEDVDIVAYQRNPGNGAQDRLETFMGDAVLTEPERELYLDSEQGIAETASAYSNESGAIGFSFLYHSRSLSVDRGINLLAVDGVYPDNDNISSGRYPLSDRIYCAVIKGRSSSAVQELLDWIISSQGQRLVEAAGYAPN